MKIDDDSKWQASHVIALGDPGSGKSTLTAQLAEAGFQLIWISLDNGHRILRKLSAEAKARIELIRLPDVKDFPIGQETIRKIFENKSRILKICDTHGMVDCKACAGKAPFTIIDKNKLVKENTVFVVDNLSQLSDSYQAQVTKDKPVDYKLQLDDWGALKFHLTAQLTNMQQFEFNLVATAHIVEEINELKEKKIMPAVGSSTFAPKVCGYFDHVVMCHLENKSHKFGSSTTYRVNFQTKSRTDVAIEGMKEASLVPFFDGQVAAEERKEEAEEAKAIVTAIPVVVPKPVLPEPKPTLPVPVAAPTVNSVSAAIEEAKPQAGKATPMHIGNATASQNERARALLAAMKLEKK